MMSRQLISESARLEILATVQEILRPYGFNESSEGCYAMGGWWFRAENDEFTVTVDQHRSGDAFAISVGSKSRPKPRAHMRGPWTLSHHRGFLDGNADHYLFSDSDAQTRWLKDNLDAILSTDFLNSDDLNKWAVKASRRMFHQGAQ